MSESEITNFEFVEVTSPWRSVLHLRFANRVLQRHVENFLDFFEQVRFLFDHLNINTGEVTQESLVGQHLFDLMKKTLEAYERHGLTPRLVKQRHMSPDGKFIMADHPRPYDGQEVNGCNTAFAAISIGSKVCPASIGLGLDYLRGARFLGLDGAYHPISIDQAVAHEMAHLAYRETEEHWPVMIESVVLTCLGGVQRDFETRKIQYTKMGNKGFHTLYDKVATRPAINMAIADTKPGLMPG